MAAAEPGEPGREVDVLHASVQQLLALQAARADAYRDLAKSAAEEERKKKRERMMMPRR